jgi:hypothetical protein
MWFFILVSCGIRQSHLSEASIEITPSAEEQIVISVTGAVVSDEAHQELILQLSAHEPTECAKLTFIDEPLIALNRVVETVTHPPWASMRAANCMVDLYPLEAKVYFIEWMETSNTKGLAYLVAGRLDEFPIDTAMDIARVGLSGPHSAGIASRLLSLQSEDLRTLVDLENP